MPATLKFAFAGDRDIAVRVLEFLLGEGHRPSALLVSSSKKASHAAELESLCAFLPPGRVLRGREFRAEPARELLRSLALDYIVGIHFPYIVPEEVLEIPRIGVLNLHPAYLPYNRGWHTPSWAILDDTPIGATLHFMAPEVDAGDIVARDRLEILPSDTADSLYGRVKQLELSLFRSAWPKLVAGTHARIPQDLSEGTTHVRQDLFREEVQRIDADEPVPPRALLRKLRALTTNDPREAAWFEEDGRRFRVRVEITEDDGAAG